MFIKTKIWTVARLEQGTAALLKPVDSRPEASRGIIPIYIGSSEAHAILAGLQKISLPRPLAHDLIMQILKETDLSISRVDINDLRDGVFFARIRLESPDGSRRDLSLDARPSDALALAARKNLPVYTHEMILKETAVQIRMVNSRSFLEKELEQAIEKEEYERAAQLRDQLSNMESS